jgi:hypothetical protein
VTSNLNERLDVQVPDECIDVHLTHRVVYA